MNTRHLALPAFLVVVVLTVGVTTQAASGAMNDATDGGLTQMPAPAPTPAPLPSPAPLPTSPTPSPYPGVDGGH